MQLSALLRHFNFPSSKTLGKATPKSIPKSNPPTEVQLSSVGKWYIKMGDKNCWEASGVERDKFKILACEIQNHQKLWGSPSKSGSIPTWGLYMIGLTPEDAVPTLLFCCRDKSVRKEMRRLIESSGILAKEEYHHIRVGDCSKPPEFCDINDKLRMLSGRQEKEYCDADEDLIRVEWEWDTLPGKMKVIFKDASEEPSSQCSTLGMTFQHLNKVFAVTASHTLSQDLHSSLHEEDASGFEFDLEEDRDTDYSDTRDHDIPTSDRRDIITVSDPWSDNDTPNPGWRPRDKIFICDHHLDFAMIQEHDPISVTPPSSYLPSLQELLQRANLEPKDTLVTAVTGSRGRIEGRLSGTPSFIRLPYAMCFQEVWTVQFNSPLAPGDSGSLVVDANSGRIFGHIVAGGPASGVAYIMPAFKVLERIQLCLSPRETVKPMSLENLVAREGGRYHSRRNSDSTLSSDLFNVYDQTRMNKRVIATAAIGFFVDSYNLFATNAVQPIMAIALGIQNPGRFGVLLNLAVLLTVPLGALVSGVVADLCGRRVMYGLELPLLIAGIFGLAFTDTTCGSLTTISTIVFWRLIMGFGIGVDYSLTAVITAEFAPPRRRATMLSVVFLAQCLGKLAAITLTIAVISPLSALSQTPAANPSETNIQGALDKAWRLVIACGSIPAIAILYSKFTIPESPRYLLDVLDVPLDLKEAKSMLSANPRTPPSRNLPEFIGNFFGFVRQPSAWRVLVGTSMSWFLLDVAFYGLGMNGRATMDRIWSTNTMSDHTLFQALAEWRMQLFLELPVGAILGGILALFVLGRTGGQKIQMAGFAALGAIFLLIGMFYYHRGTMVGGHGALFAMYIAAQLAFNLGPNTMTFIIPAGLFPTRYRGTAYGIAAASGKAGAILAQFLFLNLSSTYALSFAEIGAILVFFAVLSFLGALVTWFWVPESANRGDKDLKR